MTPDTPHRMASPLPWLGAALLSAAWLPAWGWYHAPSAWLPVLLATCGVWCLRGVALPGPHRRDAWCIIILMAIATWLAPWPYRGGALMLLMGAVLALRENATNGDRFAAAGSAQIAIPQSVSKPSWSPAFLTAGAVVSVQALAQTAYEAYTSRARELPAWLVSLLAATLRWMGMDAAATFNAESATIALRSMRQTHLMAATWELFLDPATCCFVAAGVVLLLLIRPGSAIDKVYSPLRAIGLFALLIAAWLPMRVCILLAIYGHRALRTEYDAPLALMSQFWSTGLLGALLAVPVALAWRFAPLARHADTAAANVRTGNQSRIPAAVALSVGVAAFTFWMLWQPVGQRKSGRVLIDEFHSTWEPTDKPYDTESYGRLAGYNYACLYDYLSRHYNLGRLTAPIVSDTLANCDVLVIKIPTKRYDPAEAAVIRQFVERGGGLVMIGEHTDIFGCGTYLNEVAQPFGFRFLYDCLFGIDTWYDQEWRRPLAAHPIVQPITAWDFAVSCTIAPHGAGAAVVRSTALKNLPADYHASNFYPQFEDRPDMRYGAFVQMWTTRFGAGRVVAFGDSTQFSNFCLFDPGKSDAALRMVEWANHSGGMAKPIALTAAGAGLLLTLMILLLLRRAIMLPVLVACCLAGWAVGVRTAESVHASAMPAPAPIRPLTRVIMDRTLCDAPLPKTGFIAGGRDGFGIFEMWMLRVGFFTARGAGQDALSGDILVLTHPHLQCTDSFRERVVKWVEAGGRLLIVDSPENARSTANSLLWPFGVKLARQSNHSGTLISTVGWPSVPIESACEIVRITQDNMPVMPAEPSPLATVSDKIVAVRVNHGKGSVTVIGFGSRFCDAAMGATADAVPDADLRKVYELQFAIMRGLMDDAGKSK